MRLVIELIDFKHGKSYGYEEFVFNLLRDFSRNSSQINASEIIIACREDQQSFFLPLVKEKISLFIVECKSVLGRLYYAEVLKKKLHLTENDLVFYPGDFMPLGRCKFKTMMTVHDLLFKYSNLCEHSLYFWLFRMKLYLYEPQGVRKADKVIAISDFTRNDVINTMGIEPGKVETIYNYFCFDKYDSHEELTINKIDFPYILSVCSGVKHKNHKVLLESFSELAKKRKDIHFVIVGGLHKDSLPLFDGLPGNVKQRIHFYKHISNVDLSYLYSNARLYVSASLFEGLGMPVVEALYFGLPVILSDIEVHREISFNKAIYFNPNSASALFELENNVLEGKLTGEAIDKKIIIDRYSSENTSIKYIQAINELLWGGGSL